MDNNNPFDPDPHHNNKSVSSPFTDDHAFDELDFQAPQRAASSSQRRVRGVRLPANNGTRAHEYTPEYDDELPEYQADSYDDIDRDELTKRGGASTTVTNEDEDSSLADKHSFKHKRSRWGTHRAPKRSAPKHEHGAAARLGRQMSHMFHHSHMLHKGSHSRQGTPGADDSQTDSAHAGTRMLDDDANAESDQDEQKSNEGRRIYFNHTLPRDMLDDNGLPINNFSRNKIRTTKYTPLSFVPKNLMLQFKNIANVYFLFIVILGAFPIFGVQNPGLAAVPICVIVIITMVKDAIEDYRRTLMDLEVNNGYTEILSGYDNPNVEEDHVSLWRRFKKANTRVFMGLARWLDKKKKADRVEKKTGIRPQPRSAFNRELVVASDLASIYSRESFDLGERRRNSVSDPTQERDEDTIVDPTLRVLPDVRFKPDFWKNVRVGDFVRIRADQPIPADMLILSTSEDDGACYVETKNLDGETNLKIRQAMNCGRTIQHSSECQQADFWIESEAPLPNLYSYSGAVRWQAPGSDTINAEPININNLLLRGCVLRNTRWVIGVAIFTGPESKIMLNAGITPTKRSYIQQNLNMLVIYNFALMFIICFVSGLINGISRRNRRSTFRYFEFGSPADSNPGTSAAAANGIVTFWAALILYQSLVPISLYISIEIVKTFQAFFIYSDVYMYHEPIDYPCTPKSWNISDDLGQIEYIFSDKTGTLTQNLMEFKKCTVNGVAYGKAYTEALAGMRKRQGVDVDAEGKKMAVEIEEDRQRMLESLAGISKNPQRVDDEVTFVSNDYVADLQGASGQVQADATHHFMLCLALCNSVITEKALDERVSFKAQSPDEAALVGTARDMGFALAERTRRGLLVDVQGHEIEYILLNTLEFNSTRKRMSAIVKMPDTGKILLICKGADSVIYSRLAECQPGDQQDHLRQKTAVQLEEFANEGLRTLCVAQREISQKEYEQFSREYDIAAAEIVDREHKLEDVATKIETNLTLIGGTAIEDRLQEGVPRTIQLLGDGGIKLWVLTGDKVETAINIGFSCNLLTSDMKLNLIKVENDDKGSVPAQIDEMLFKNFGLEGTWEELENAKNDHSSPKGEYAVIIDGDALKLALNQAIQHKFLLLCKQCKAVMCCRVSPAQKAAVVRLVRTNLEVITLAIGDGANDVAMIQEANVGVGIAGEEGRQAVMSSDYAFGQFRFLARLLLVHGRYSYRRLAEMIPNFFYKNALFTLTLFWYGVFSDFDATYLYDYTYLMLYNLAFTSLPVIIMGIIDQDVPDRISLAVPQLYRRGILRKDFSHTKFWLYMGEGLYQSFVCFFFPYFCYFRGNFVDLHAYPGQHRFYIGLASCTLSVMSCNLYVITNQYRWDWFSMLINVISTLLVWVWSGIYSSIMYSAESYGLGHNVYSELIFWAVVLLGTITCLIFHFMFMTIRAFLDPQDIDIIREQWRIGEFDTVMATPLAADDPDAARYENPYRPETHTRSNAAPQWFKHRRANRQRKQKPYEIASDPHEDILRSPDVVRVGGRDIQAEEYEWGSLSPVQSSATAESSRDLFDADTPQTMHTARMPSMRSAHSGVGRQPSRFTRHSRQGSNDFAPVHERAEEGAPSELRRSLDIARTTSRHEQPPQEGMATIETTAGMEDELTTAFGLMKKQDHEDQE